ncbi:hypothetical protein FS837_001619, partial [Tulasnella sp. UAMH 9824]
MRGLELDLHFLPVLKQLPELFQGATPRLNVVRLYGTLALWHCNIFRDLRELVIDVSLRSNPGLSIQLENLSQALKSSPALHAGLSSIIYVPLPAQGLNWSLAAHSLIAAIRISSCAFVSIKCDSPTPSFSEFPRDFWPTIVEVLRVTETVDIIFSPSRLSVVTRAAVSPHVNVEFTSASSAERMLIDLLMEAEFSQPLSTEVYLTVESRDAFPSILEFLVKRTELGTEKLPRLQELYLKLHMVLVEIVADLILEHEELQSVLWSRSLTIGEGWSEPEEIKQRILVAPPQQRWL